MKTILAIDDDKWVLETLKDALTIRGYEVLTAASGDEGLRLFKNSPVDLILLDLNMPGKNGFQIYRELESVRRAPVLFVSGCSRSFNPLTDGFTGVWQDLFSQGLTDILYKPFPIALLYEKVEGLIGDAGVVEHEPAH
jgi:two-component system response regulator TrcR